jgi:hypothetical protein
MGQHYLSLSLFIILLCFFLVLNSLSTFEPVKAQSAMNSLQSALTGSSPSDEGMPSLHFTPTENSPKGDALDQLKGLFSAQIKTFKASTNRMGTEMMVRLPVSEFEKSLQSAAAAGISPENAFERKGGAFLPTLVSLMETAQSTVPYRMDILLNIPGDPADLGASGKDLVLKASGYSDTLERAGLPRKLISAGLAQAVSENAFEGEGDLYIELYFRRYVPVDPLAGERLADHE